MLRRLLGLVLGVVGGAVLGHLALGVPAALPLALPPWSREALLGGAGGLAALGLLLLLAGSRRRAVAGGDGDVAGELAGRGFRRVALDRDGWLAEGLWEGIPLAVRRRSDQPATRFGRPWVLTVTLPGQPREPWPFLPDQGLILERQDARFTVVVADSAVASAAAFRARVQALIAARR